MNRKCAYQRRGECSSPVTHEIKAYFTGPPSRAGKSLFLCTGHANLYAELHPKEPVPTPIMECADVQKDESIDPVWGKMTGFDIEALCDEDD